MFTHEKLQVYAKALEFIAQVGNWTSKWEKKHAIADHLPRAAESVALNLAEGARQRSVPARVRSLDYSVGSSLECAACLDIAGIKSLFTPGECLMEKAKLCEITKMLVGLRKAWRQLCERSRPMANQAHQSLSFIMRIFRHIASP
jgi:four helix bundle protein